MKALLSRNLRIVVIMSLMFWVSLYSCNASADEQNVLFVANGYYQQEYDIYNHLYDKEFDVDVMSDWQVHQWTNLSEYDLIVITGFAPYIDHGGLYNIRTAGIPVMVVGYYDLFYAYDLGLTKWPVDDYYYNVAPFVEVMDFDHEITESFDPDIYVYNRPDLLFEAPIQALKSNARPLIWGSEWWHEAVVFVDDARKIAVTGICNTRRYTPEGWELFDRILCYLTDTCDVCPNDPEKEDPGQCGCGNPDFDEDGDGTADCVDLCPQDPNKTEPGIAGCGNAETDGDGDCVPDAIDINVSNPTNSISNTCASSADGTACYDGICPGKHECSGGICGDPQECAPCESCTLRVFKNSTYWFCNCPTDWEDASDSCAAVSNASLIRIGGSPENQFIACNLASISGLGDAWIGANDITSEGTWRWAKASTVDGQRFWDGGANGSKYYSAFSSWVTGQPAGGTSQNCAAMIDDGNQKWNDRACTETKAFICEMAAPTVVPGNIDPNELVPDACELAGVPCDVFQIDSDNCVAEADLPIEEDWDATSDEMSDCADDDYDSDQASIDAHCQGTTAVEPDWASSNCSENDPDVLCPLSSVPPGEPMYCGGGLRVYGDSEHDNECIPPLMCGKVYVCCDIESETAGEVTNLDCDYTTRCEGGNSIDDNGQGTCSGTNKRCMEQRVCGVPDSDCLNLDTNITACVEQDVCDVDSKLTFTGLNDSDSLITPKEFGDDEFDEPAPPADEETYPEEPADPCAGNTNSSGDCNYDRGAHPFCKYAAIDPLGEQSPNPGDKKGDSGSSGVSFYFTPDLNLEYGVDVGPLGIPKFGVAASASLKAGVELNNVLKVTKDLLIVDINLGVDAGFFNPEISAQDCGFSTADSTVSIFGIDFLPDAASTTQPSADIQAKCGRYYDKVVESVDRAKKAYKDAQELVEAWRNLGEDQNFVGLCEQLTADAPSDFPAGNCSTERAEDTINRFIKYYNENAITDMKGRLSDLEDLVNTIDANLHVDLGNPIDETIEETIFTTTFMVGPVPANLEVFVNLAYGFGIGADFTFKPGPLLETAIASFTQMDADASDPFVKVSVTGTPYAGMGIGLFVGVGFDFGALSIKAGIEGVVQLAKISVPITGGAGLAIGTTTDDRGLPEYIADYTGGSPFLPKKKFDFRLVYDYSAGIQIRKVLSGYIGIKIKIKFFFFSKTWKKRIVEWDGFCDGDNMYDWCDITLFNGGGSVQLAEGDVPWGQVQTPMPFMDLNYIDEDDYRPEITSDSDSGAVTFDKGAVVQEFFFNRLCTCIAEWDDYEAHGIPEDERPQCEVTDDCCEGLYCYEDADIGARVCQGECLNNGKVCDEDSQCCTGICYDDPSTSSMTKVCVDPLALDEPCNEDHECDSNADLGCWNDSQDDYNYGHCSDKRAACETCNSIVDCNDDAAWCADEPDDPNTEVVCGECIVIPE